MFRQDSLICGNVWHHLPAELFVTMPPDLISNTLSHCWAMLPASPLRQQVCCCCLSMATCQELLGAPLLLKTMRDALTNCLLVLSLPAHSPQLCHSRLGDSHKAQAGHYGLPLSLPTSLESCRQTTCWPNFLETRKRKLLNLMSGIFGAPSFYFRYYLHVNSSCMHLSLSE